MLSVVSAATWTTVVAFGGLERSLEMVSSAGLGNGP